MAQCKKCICEGTYEKLITPAGNEGLFMYCTHPDQKKVPVSKEESGKNLPCPFYSPKNGGKSFGIFFCGKGFTISPPSIASGLINQLISSGKLEKKFSEYPVACVRFSENVHINGSIAADIYNSHYKSFGWKSISASTTFVIFDMTYTETNSTKYISIIIPKENEEQSGKSKKKWWIF